MSDAAAALWKAMCMEADAHPRRRGRAIRLKPKDRLIEKLETTFGIHSVYVTVPRGYWSHNHQDCYRWEFGGYKACGNPDCRRHDCITFSGGSYDPISLCVRKDHKLEWVSDMHDGEISAVKMEKHDA